MTPEQKERYLNVMCNQVSPHKEFAQHQLTIDSLRTRIAEVNLDPNDLDLNPHMNLVHVADKVVADLRADGFNKANREGVYLAWLYLKIYHPRELVVADKSDEDMSDLPWDDEDDDLARGV